MVLQAGGVGELGVGLVSVGPDQCPQIPHGLLKLGVCLENHRELADPLPISRGHQGGEKTRWRCRKIHCGRGVRGKGNQQGKEEKERGRERE